MRNLSYTGRLFYGAAIAGMGLQAIYCHDFPYILSLPEHFWAPGHIALAYVFGALLFLAGASLLFEKRPRQISLLFGAVLLLLFCFYYIPYEFLTSPNYFHFEEWENAEKELTLASGAFIVAACFPEKNENRLTLFLGKLIPLGTIFFAITMICYGTLHFRNAKGVSGYEPSWVPDPLFWAYFAGAALLGSGVAIILKIKTGLIAALLGIMIFTWFISLHIPKVVAAPAADRAGEITSAFLALAYSGIAFVISGAAGKKAANPST